ncbi:MAG: putative transcriptional regulator [Frankiales bacterium]|nr:putative transcriptional regulator [Frankiales bacterium]
MTVHAQSADSAPPPAKAQPSHLRSDSSLTAGTYPLDDDVRTDWHVHDLHQVEYAFQGVVQVETDSARYLLPPQQAVWIPAGLVHRTTLKNVRTVSVFFDPVLINPGQQRARVLIVTPVLREMIVYAARWPITRTGADTAADTFFLALADVLTESLANEAPFHLPTSADPVIAEAMRFTDRHLQSVTLDLVCAHSAMSERTLRRRFFAATSLTWRQYLLRSRLLRAMSLLSQPDVTVLSVAVEVGFESPSAFARSFTAYTGQTPSAYRRQACSSGQP